MKNEPATYSQWQVKAVTAEAKAKASLKRAKLLSLVVDPNPGDLTMSRMKLG